jgi:hypothetical protein
MREAKVICRQLGFRETIGAPTNYKVGNTRVDKLYIACAGREETIGDCHVTHVTGACTGDGVVGAYCSTTSAEDTRAMQKSPKPYLIHFCLHQV